MTKPDFSYEKEQWDRGVEYVIGIDEVGRGAFAGPVVVAGVVFSSGGKQYNPSVLRVNNITMEQSGVDDSKRLTAKKREELDSVIKENCLAWKIVEVGVPVINRIGIGRATEKAMRKCINNIVKLLYCHIVEKGKGTSAENNTTIQQYSNCYVLIDGFQVRNIKGIGLTNQTGIIKGDQKSISIAGASIIAKVYRDKLITRLSTKYPQYRWEENKGYGTERHRKAIVRYGCTRLHRKAFVETWKRKKVISPSRRGVKPRRIIGNW